MLQRCLLTDADVEQILAAALRTLAESGIMLQSERFLRELEARGAVIDWPRECARIPTEVALALLPDVLAVSGGEDVLCAATFPKPGRCGVGTQVAQLLYDHGGACCRAATEEDFVRLVRFGDALHREGGVGHVIIMRDIPQPLEPLRAQALLIEHTHRPTSSYFYYVEQLPYAAEIGEIYCGNRERFCGGGVFITSPLRLCRRSCSLMEARISMGFAGSAGTMPVAGASVPATMAGSITVAAAEILGVWAAYRALREDVPLHCGIAAGATDLRTGGVSFCSPEAMLLDFGVAEFFRRLCGQAVGVSGGSDYCDAKVPGLSAAREKAHKAMTVAAFTGMHPGVGQGMIDSGKVLSPEQILIDRDASAGVSRLFQPVIVDAEHMALESIVSVGQGLERTHLETDHTLRHCREALWAPDYHDFAPVDTRTMDFERDQVVVEKAHRHYCEVSEQYEAPEVPEDALRAIAAVVGRAERAMDGWDLG